MENRRLLKPQRYHPILWALVESTAAAIKKKPRHVIEMALCRMYEQPLRNMGHDPTTMPNERLSADDDAD